ncbi:N-acetyltransferase GCN5 [Thermincola ferriacetica]|uniref:GCN5-related N-acetyltransferase n=2 Tax=Thermincola TaxID=278993 RepID=D5X9Z8_THEPJ|nr:MULTISPECIES: N-acetyltransferase [Thermincola]ADG83131.1 GCN5-related N-acetyltransferase [Thermincola potens JR]KNZ70619.1 N-acetyltransferase GCN5 [Thermincola ferriacetica]
MIYRKAKITDVEDIHALLAHYAGEGLMLARPRSKLYESIREFSVAEKDGKIVGAGSLHIIWEDLAEVRALAVAPEYREKGIGRTLVNIFLEEARNLGIPKVFTLTYQRGFFEKCGFRLISKDVLPHKVWKECIDCPKFPNCDENALVIDL